MAESTALDTVRAAASGGVRRFSGPAGIEQLAKPVTPSRLALCFGPGPDLGARLALARERLGKPIALELVLDGAALLTADGDELWRTACDLRDLGGCQSVGIAAAPGEDALGLARRFKPDSMQMSVGLLDQRLIHSGALAEITSMGVEVQLRTALLHSLLFLPREGLPAPLADAGPQVSRVRRTIAEAGADPLQAALGFALARPEAALVIVEASSPGEVRALLAAAAAPLPELDWPALALNHPAALDAEGELYRRAAA